MCPFHAHQLGTVAVYGAVFAANPSRVQPRWAWFEGVQCIRRYSRTRLTSIMVGHVPLSCSRKVLCVLGLSDKSRRAMFHDLKHSHERRLGRFSPLQDRHGRCSWLTRSFPAPPLRARGIVGQSPYLLMLQPPFWGIRPFLLSRHLCRSRATTACMVHATVGPSFIQLISFPLDGSLFPHPAYC
ncbi:hypothetical protein K458DRAFT_197794 [Lentithecium fluviatile CBS 122367]|uniref:Uncharacterized protein n=1 Tax=Lentithecium fluviatile CBS 122367 TaxID=1168545 RepID=A0A6G1IC60_9PLEO|nr:hypothetical protein K458DRAFT_197794 [Lentithecium fluviatile CBS 122367]